MNPEPTPGNKFTELLTFLQRINPAALVTGYKDRQRSATRNGIDLADNLSGRVLILGCGDGFEVEYARTSKAWDAVGITFHEEEMTYGAASERNDMVMGDIHCLPFPDESFDAVYSKETLEHSPCPFLALVESNRVLRKNGKFFHLIADGWNKQRDWYHFSCLPDWIWADLLRKAGFHVSEIRSWPRVGQCTFENKAYLGRKVLARRLTDAVADYKSQLDFGDNP